jgi:acyltransferase
MDVFRGLGIILMVMGHVGFGGKFDHFIHAFHMPMFFFVSGFFYRKRECKVCTFVTKKAKTLLIPYITFALAHWLIFIILYGFSVDPLLHIFTINTDGLPIAGALWFLTALFFTDIIYFLLDRWNIKWLILLFVLVGSLSNRILPYTLPWALSASFVGLGLYWLGELSRKHEDKLKLLLNMNEWQVLVIGIPTIGLIFVNSYVNMREGNYAIIPLFWFNALLAIYLGISISKIICNRIKVKWISSIGRNSIVYVCMNQITIVVVGKMLRYIISSNIVIRLFTLGLSMIVLYCLSLIFTKTRLKILIGK